MQRELRFLLFVSFAVSCAVPKSVENGGTSQTDAATRVLAIGDAIVKQHFEESPLTVALLRPPGSTYDRLPDDSIAGIQARQAQRRAWLGELRQIDRGALAASPAAQLTYDIAVDDLEAQEKYDICRSELWAVSQTANGWQLGLASLANAQPVGTDALRAQALSRFSQVPGYVDVRIANLREGLARGYSAARINVQETVEELDAMIAAAPDKSPFFRPAEADGSPAFRGQLAALVRDGIDPALGRYRDYLKAEYLPKAREAIGVSANPDGAACYRAALLRMTTLPETPEELHAIGLAQLDQIEKEMQAISRRSFGGEDVKTLLRRFRTDKAYLYRDRAQMIAEAEASIARAKAAMPRAFHLLPKADVVVQPIPAFAEKTASAHYEGSALDGSRPATYWIRVYQPEKQSRVNGESVAFHETIPGHHLQNAIAHERESLPPIARYSWHSGFGEGWGLYAERLADELGLFTDDAARIGMLANETFRAARLVVDTGMHAFGWDRKKAIDTLLAHTALSEDQAAAEVDRYIAWPGQATAYMVGYLEIRRLREEAEKALGPAFDLRAFHDRVLENGSVPLTVLRAHVEAWIHEQKAKTGLSRG